MIRLVSSGSAPDNIIFETVTPKQYAANALAAAVQGFTECGELPREMTEREKALVWAQIHKLEARIYKMLRVE